MTAFLTGCAGIQSYKMPSLSPLPKAATLSLSQISATVDTARALQVGGFFHASQTKYVAALAALSQQKSSSRDDQKTNALEAKILAGMRGNLPYAISSSPDQDITDELDGLALLDSLNPSDTAFGGLSTSDSLRYMKEFQLDSTIRFDLPIQANGRVLSALLLFKERIPKHFAVWMSRKGRYESQIREKLHAAGLPEDLVYLAMIESGFNPKAYSPAGASGLWQFMAPSGRRFGLRVDRYVDERRDPDKATDAAIQYLSFLYNHFGDWNLAMGAYNCGEGGMGHAIKRSGMEHPSYWDLALNSETRNYVPRIYAAAVLSKNPTAHGFNITPWEPLSSDTFTVDGGMSFGKIAEALHCSPETLAVLNPALTRRMTPPTHDSYQLHIPAGTRDAFALIYPSLEKSYSAPEPTRWVHRIHRGETLSSIAARYGVSTQDLRAWNRLDRRSFRPGRTLTIYGDPADSRIVISEDVQRRRRRESGSLSDAMPAAAPAVTATHRVHSGETLGSIAERYHTTIAALRKLNNLKGHALRAGQKIKVQQGATEKSVSRERSSRKDREADSRDSRSSKKRKSAATRRYRVHAGDSLYSIAQKNSVSVDDLQDLNGLKGKSIRPGQVLRIPAGG